MYVLSCYNLLRQFAQWQIVDSIRERDVNSQYSLTLILTTHGIPRSLSTPVMSIRLNVRCHLATLVHMLAFTVRQ